MGIVQRNHQLAATLRLVMGPMKGQICDVSCDILRYPQWYPLVNV